MTNHINETLLNRSEIESQGDALLSTEAVIIFQWILFCVFGQPVDLFGVCTNIINIMCFIKQGFKDPVNVSLLGLAVSDMACLTTLMWTNLCYTPGFSSLDLPFVAEEFQYLVSAIPHVTFVRITAWITAFITLERCLCISAPLKVKQIITPKRVSVTIALIYIILSCSVAPIYVVNRLGIRYVPERNKSLLGLIFTDNRHAVESVSFAINNAIVPALAFFIIIVCTVVLAFKLQANNQWRKTSTNIKKAENVSNRNQKIAKMVVIISSIFIGCFIPNSVIFLARTLEPELTFDGKHKNLLIVVAGLGLFLESVNSTVNIFVYYYMSSKYKETFRAIFRGCINPGQQS